jgi:hypothetical protein
MSTPETAATGTRAASTIAAVARAMYPHDAVPDEVYAKVSATLAESAKEDADTARIIEDGVAGLDSGTPFADRSPEEQLSAVQAIEGTEFFDLVRSTAVVDVYNDARTWAAFGYEGSSFEKGGYINRGFNDLDWLPDPEEES